MNPWWTLGTYAAWGIFVWQIHSWYDGSQQAAELAAQTAAAHSEMKASFKIDEEFNQAITDLGTFQTNINRSLEHETPLPDCRLTAGRVSALRKAIVGDLPAR